MKKNTQKKTSQDSSTRPQDQLAYNEEVSRRAYELWEAAGCNHGADTTHWLAAEREVQTRRAADENQLDGLK
jgi:hypothetical protein